MYQTKPTKLTTQTKSNKPNLRNQAYQARSTNQKIPAKTNKSIPQNKTLYSKKLTAAKSNLFSKLAKLIWVSRLN